MVLDTDGTTPTDLTIPLTDHPGSLTQVARTLGDIGANLELFYVATGSRIVLAAEDHDELTAALR